MTESKHALSASVVVEFCKLCDWAHEVWRHHLELFDNNPRATELQNSSANAEWARLCTISQEYSLLQIVKLHDEAVMSGHDTLGIDYVLKYGDWSDSIRDRLTALAKKLDDFGKPLRNVRNKILSHNDLAKIVAGAPLGAFEKGADEEYFNTLQEFVNTVYSQIAEDSWPSNDHVKSDVAAFLATVKP